MGEGGYVNLFIQANGIAFPVFFHIMVSSLFLLSQHSYFHFPAVIKSYFKSSL